MAIKFVNAHSYDVKIQPLLISAYSSCFMKQVVFLCTLPMQGDAVAISVFNVVKHNETPSQSYGV